MATYKGSGDPLAENHWSKDVQKELYVHIYMQMHTYTYILYVCVCVHNFLTNNMEGKQIIIVGFHITMLLEVHFQV